MKLLPILTCMILISGCKDSDLGKNRSVQCYMTFSDNCKATLSSGKTIWVSASSSSETTVSGADEEECNRAADNHQFSGPETFYFESGNVKAKDAIQPAGDYLIKDNAGVQFHYKKVGEANFRLGEETGAMTCTTRTSGELNNF